MSLESTHNETLLSNGRSSTEQLGDEMKVYEAQYEQEIVGDHAFIIRADGHSFSKFTRGFFQPFDHNFKKAMIQTMNDCLEEFPIRTGYTHSDEITLIFDQAPLKNTSKNKNSVTSDSSDSSDSSVVVEKYGKLVVAEKSGDDSIIAEKSGDDSIIAEKSGDDSIIAEKSDDSIVADIPIEVEKGCERQAHFFNGRVCKILTLVSSYISVRFNYNLINFLEEHQKSAANQSIPVKSYPKGFIDRIKNMRAHFDARVLVFPPDKLIDITRHMIWRSLKDCTRNCISTYARSFFSEKQLHGLHTGKMIEMMKEQSGFDFETQVPEDLKIGTYAKKRLYETDAIDKKTDQPVKVMRTRIVNVVLRAQNNSKFLEILLAKYID